MSDNKLMQKSNEYNEGDTITRTLNRPTKMGFILVSLNKYDTFKIIAPHENAAIILDYLDLQEIIKFAEYAKQQFKLNE